MWISQCLLQWNLGFPWTPVTSKEGICLLFEEILYSSLAQSSCVLPSLFCLWTLKPTFFSFEHRMLGPPTRLLKVFWVIPLHLVFWLAFLLSLLRSCLPHPGIVFSSVLDFSPALLPQVLVSVNLALLFSYLHLFLLVSFTPTFIV